MEFGTFPWSTAIHSSSKCPCLGRPKWKLGVSLVLERANHSRGVCIYFGRVNWLSSSSRFKQNLECEDHISDEDVDDSNGHDYVDEEVISEVSDYE